MNELPGAVFLADARRALLIRGAPRRYSIGRYR